MMNIAGTTPVEDPEYRYKMPRIIGKVEGRGNGIKTAIPNMTQVAMALHRSPGEVTKFFGCDLGAQTTWTEDTERAIVNGAHTTPTLQDKLSVYIEKFVLCPSCKLPETDYKIRNEIIYHQCVACGARSPVDMQHKLTTFILKNYKIEKKAREKKKKNDDDDDKKKKKKSSSKGEKGEKSEKADKPERTEAEKAERKRKKKEKAAAAAAAAASEQDDDDDDDQDDLVEDSDAMESAISRLRVFLAKDNVQPDAVISEVRAVQTFCAIPRNERAFILVSALFGEDPIRALNPDARAVAVLLALKADSGHVSLIGGFEKFVSVAYPDKLLAKFPVILKKLYDTEEEVLEEENILDWNENLPEHREQVPEDVTDDMRSVLFKAAQPLITWLQEAEEDGSEEEDED